VFYNGLANFEKKMGISKRIKKPWPTKAAMTQVYKNKLWGDNQSEFYSGEGSHLPTIVEPYIQEVCKFLKQFEHPISVCDLGCGDFNIGKQIVEHTSKYLAIDIVESLIEYNKTQFQANQLEFKCLDIAKDPIPKADCVLIRQVLQHLSNSEVQAVLSKLNQYQYIILTEHIPNGTFTPNLDIISGQGIRIKKGSGLDITAEPFNFKVKKEKQLLSTTLEGKKGRISTSLFENKG
jgi:hypothetical protein